jgi:putative transposase
MPWKETEAMSERMQMVSQYLSEGESVSQLARWFGVSRKTVYKWIARYEQMGARGLEELSRAPQHHPHALSEQMEKRILEWKAHKPLWGAPKIHAKLLGLPGCPCESTVSNVLARHGLVRKLRRRPRATPSASPLGHCARVNQVWCADLKGYLRMGNGQRCDPLTITDAHSRYLLCCQGLVEGTSSLVIKPLFIATFREFGMPQAIRTDNGSPFASIGLGGLSALSVWWLDLGIRLERIEPGKPQQNSRHERMHRTLKEATARPPRGNFKLQQQAFEAFRWEYNQERPHEALGQKPPASLYRPSVRDYPEGKLAPWDYPELWAKRVIRPGGRIRWQGREVNITRALCGREIGLEPVGEARWAIHYRSLCLGVWDQRKGRLEPAKTLQWDAGTPQEPEAATSSHN